MLGGSPWARMVSGRSCIILEDTSLTRRSLISRFTAVFVLAAIIAVLGGARPAAAVTAPTVVDQDLVVTSGITKYVMAPGLLTGATDPYGTGLTAQLVSQPLHGNVEILSDDGAYLYMPDPGFTGPDLFMFEAWPDGPGIGLLPSNIAIVWISVVGPLTAVDDAYVTPQDTPLVVSGSGVIANDSNSLGKVVSVIEITQPAAGKVAMEENGAFTYTPDAGFTGITSFTYTIWDLTSKSTATVTIDVRKKSHAAPVGQDDAYDSEKDTPLVISAPGVLANDSDSDGDAIAVQEVELLGPGQLTMSSDGAFVYTPAPGFTGSTSFTYTVTDGWTESKPVTVTITFQKR